MHTSLVNKTLSAKQRGRTLKFLQNRKEFLLSYLVVYIVILVMKKHDRSTTISAGKSSAATALHRNRQRYRLLRNLCGTFC